MTTTLYIVLYLICGIIVALLLMRYFREELENENPYSVGSSFVGAVIGFPAIICGFAIVILVSLVGKAVKLMLKNDKK